MQAKAVFDRAADLYPDYGSIYAHRARVSRRYRGRDGEGSEARGRRML